MTPGTALRTVLGECGISMLSGACGCAAMAEDMDTWGIDACDTTHRREIVAHLQEKASEATWSQWGRVAARGYVSCESLLDEAIRRCRLKEDDK